MVFQGADKQTGTPERRDNHPSALSNAELLLYSVFPRTGHRLERGGPRGVVIPSSLFDDQDRTGHLAFPGRQQHRHREEVQQGSRMFRTQSRSETTPSRRAIIYEAIESTLEILGDDDHDGSLFSSQDDAATGEAEEDLQMSNISSSSGSSRGGTQDDDEDNSD
jgi:hypothetical protein